MNTNQICSRTRRLALLVAVLAVSLTPAITSISFAAQNQKSPQPVDSVDIVPAGMACTFAVEVATSGKTKTIDLPHDRLISVFPGLDATVTNLEDRSKQVSLNITGGFHQTLEPDGTVVTVLTGRNLLLDPEAGFVLAIGHFRFDTDSTGNVIRPLAGHGRLIDMCATIE